MEGKLADHQHSAFRLGQVAVHLALLVSEDAQADDLLRQPAGVVGSIADLDAEQDEQAVGDPADDLAADFHAGLAYSLHHGTHASGFHISSFLLPGEVIQ